ncbi:MAG: glycosyltransferase family 4 protein [Chloroflexi bacterium]|nr:glycosyltransferase family 4 protein [Chloroflexota bacterium]
MKIGLVSPYDYSHPGGVINHVSYLAHHLDLMGHQVKIIAPVRRTGTRYFGVEVTAIGRPIPIPYGGTTARIPLSPWLPFQVKRVLNREAFDIIHLHEPLIPMLCLSVLRESPAPLNVGTFHACHKGSALYWLNRPTMRRLGEKLHGKIAVSKPARDYISKYLPADYRIIPNGVDVHHYQPDGPLRTEFKDDRLNIFFVGRLEERKGVGDLIRACALVKKDFPEFRLIIAGPGIRLRFYYQMLAKSLVGDNVVFTDYVPFNELPKYYRTADIFCAPATGGESFGIVLIEAMASGTPVVATSIPGYASVLTDGQEGLLAMPENPRSLADALLRLLNDRQARLKMAQNGLATAEQYSWENVSRQVLEYYLSLSK